jgi:hypothetical protein
MGILGRHRLQSWVRSVLMREPSPVVSPDLVPADSPEPFAESDIPSDFDPANIPVLPSEAVQETVREIRGDRPPAILLHGALQRTGTNYVAALLALHPDIASLEGVVYEFAFLTLVGDIMAMQKKFEARAAGASGTRSPSDFAALFGTGMLTHLCNMWSKGNRVLLKVPGVGFLNYFPVAFAHEHLLLLNRDGRDVVESIQRSWPAWRFEDACRDWDRSAKLMLAFQQRMAGSFTFDMIRYEDAVREPEMMIRRLCQKFDLDESRYPFEQIESVPLLGSSALRRWGQDEWQWKRVQRPKDFDPFGRWKKWGPEEKNTFKRIAGQSLIDSGYADDKSW